MTRRLVPGVGLDRLASGEFPVADSAVRVSLVDECRFREVERQLRSVSFDEAFKPLASTDNRQFPGLRPTLAYTFADDLSGWLRGVWRQSVPSRGDTSI